MKKLLVIVSLLANNLYTFSQQQKLVDAQNVKIGDALFFDGAWRRKWPVTDNVDGGVVSWVSGYTFAVTSATYTIRGKEYSFAGGTIALNAAHSTLNRIDVLALNTSGQLVKITGTPSALPAIPQVTAATQLLLTAILVPAGSSTPGIIREQIYNENTEWTIGGSTFPTANFAATTTPQSGSVDISISGTGATDVSASGEFKAGGPAGPYNYSDYSVLRFYIRLSSAWAPTASLQIALGNGGEILTPVTAAHGFNPSLVNVWQNVSVPLSDLNKSGPQFSAFYFTVSGNGKSFLLDNIELQGSVGTGGGSGYLTDVYRRSDTVFKVYQSGAIYAYKDSVGTGGGGGGIGTLNGQTNGTQTFVAGTAGSNFAITSSAGVHTFNIPDAGTGSRGLITSSTQTIAGSKTFTSKTIFSNDVDMGASNTPGFSKGLNLRYDNSDYTGITIDNLQSTGAAGLLIRNDGGYNKRSGIVKLSSAASFGYSGPNSLNFINYAADPIGFAVGNVVAVQLDGNGDLKYTRPHSVATVDHIPSRGQVDSLMNKKLADSGFAVVRPITPGDVKLFETISGQKLQISDLKNSPTLTWTKNSDSTISGTVVGGGGTFSGSIAANQVAFGTASNTLGGNNNLYSDGSHLSIGTTDLSQTLQLRTADGGSLFKMHSTDANCDIIGSSSASAFEGSNRIRFEDGFRFIANSSDVMKVKQSGNIKFFGGVEFAGKQTITTGTASTIADNVFNVYVDPATLLATQTITMPANPSDGQEVRVFFGGTIAAGATVVTTLTISANAGQSLYQAITPTTAKGGDVLGWSFNSSNSKWYRIIN